MPPLVAPINTNKGARRPPLLYSEIRLPLYFLALLRISNKPNQAGAKQQSRVPGLPVACYRILSLLSDNRSGRAVRLTSADRQYPWPHSRLRRAMRGDLFRPHGESPSAESAGGPVRWCQVSEKLKYCRMSGLKVMVEVCSVTEVSVREHYRGW